MSTNDETKPQGVKAPIKIYLNWYPPPFKINLTWYPPPFKINLKFPYRDYLGRDYGYAWDYTANRLRRLRRNTQPLLQNPTHASLRSHGHLPPLRYGR